MRRATDQGGGKRRASPIIVRYALPRHVWCQRTETIDFGLASNDAILIAVECSALVWRFGPVEHKQREADHDCRPYRFYRLVTIPLIDLPNTFTAARFSSSMPYKS
jgi:hypothetical protein